MASPRAKTRRPAPSARPPASPQDQDINRYAWVLVLLALLVRIPNLAWGLPDLDEEALPMKKALDMWGWGRGAIDFDPRTAGWPSLSFYVHLAWQHLHYGLGRITGAFADRNDFLVSAWTDRGSLLLAARALSVAAAVAIVWITARAARRLAGALAGWLAGGLLAVSPLLVQYSQLVTPDILAALFAALAVDRILTMHERGRWRDALWAGLWIGLGISSKYTPLLLAPGLFVAQALRPATRRAMLHAWGALAIAVVAFALTSPYVAFQPARLMRDVSSQSLHMTLGHFGQSAMPSGVFYVVSVLGPGLGWGGLLLAITGLGWAAIRRGGAWWVLLGCVLPYYLGLGALKAQFPRYVLPLLMPIALGLAGLVAALRARAQGPGAGNLPRAWSVALAVAALGPALLGLVQYHVQQGRPDARQLANRYLADTLGSSRPRVVAENLSITLPTARGVDTLDPELLARLSPAQRTRVMSRVTYDIDYLPMYTVQPERAAFYYDLRHFADFDYVVTSEAVRGRYHADSARFFPQARFYGDLDRYARLERRFGREQGATGPEIRLYHLTPEGLAALRRERGPLDLAAAARAGAPFHPPDFLTFIEGVARAAMARRDWASAASYYRLLLEAGRQQGMNPESLASLARLVADLEAQAAGSEPR